METFFFKKVYVFLYKQKVTPGEKRSIYLIVPLSYSDPGQ